MRATIYTVKRTGSGVLSTMAGPRGGDWLADEMAAVRHAGTDVLVSMLTAGEHDELDLGGEQSAASAAGLRFLALPTPDFGTPDTASFLERVRQLVGDLREGRSVVIHCRGGIGRSSMLAAGILIAEGVRPGAAWRQVSEARGLDVPETAEQRAWVERVMEQFDTDPS
jgi:protein-tyrosine phosphatase